MLPPTTLPMKPEKWGSMHVTIAWKVYSHQQKVKQQMSPESHELDCGLQQGQKPHPLRPFALKGPLQPHDLPHPSLLLARTGSTHLSVPVSGPPAGPPLGSFLPPQIVHQDRRISTSDLSRTTESWSRLQHPPSPFPTAPQGLGIKAQQHMRSSVQRHLMSSSPMPLMSSAKRPLTSSAQMHLTQRSGTFLAGRAINTKHFYFR
ncbi:autism susceptibility gene 2 protein homolog isoform X2 [Alosa sapidissima]|nr:autism susceptibility gene 2 protein homolog isoform X2 [Alosa sapidissima]